MNTTTLSDINLSEDPLKTLLNTVIGLNTGDGATIRGRLIKFDDNVIWLEKRYRALAMVARRSILRLWVAPDQGRR